MGQECSTADSATADETKGKGGNRRRTTRAGSSKNQAHLTSLAEAVAAGQQENGSPHQHHRRSLRRMSDDADAGALEPKVGDHHDAPSSTQPAGLQSLAHTSIPHRNFIAMTSATAAFNLPVNIGSSGLASSLLTVPATTALPPPISARFREYHSASFGGAATEGFLACVSAEGILPYAAAANQQAGPHQPPRKGVAVCAGEDKNIYLINYETGHVLRTFRKAHTRDIKVLTRPVGGTFFSGGRDGLIKRWSVDAPMGGGSSSVDAPSMEYKGHSLIVTAVAPLFRNGAASSTLESQQQSWCGATRLVSGSRDNTVRLWDVATGKCLSTMDVKLNLVHFLHEIGGGGIADGMVAQGGEDLTVRLWDTRLENHGCLSLVTTLANFDYHPLCAASVPDTPFYFANHHTSGSAVAAPSGHYLYTGHNGFNGKGSMIMEWDIRIQKATRSFHGHSMSVRCMCFARVAVPLELQQQQQGGLLEAFLGLNTVLVTASDDGTIKFWDVSTPTGGTPLPASGTSPPQQQFLASITIPEGKVNSIDQSPTTGRLILALQSGSIIVLDPVLALRGRKSDPEQGSADAGAAASVECGVGSRFRYFGRPDPDVS